MTATRILSPALARQLAVSRQQLSGPLTPATPAKIMDVARNIRCLQLDPINVIARSHQIVLWSRLGVYNLADFDTLLWQEKQLFEYWAHAASMVLTEDYPIHQYHMRRWGTGDSKWGKRVQHWLKENQSFQQYILNELKERGPLFPTDIEDRAVTPWESGGWTAGRHVDRMLSFLWEQGQIMVAGRKGIKRQWDLIERCLPNLPPDQELSQTEVVRQAAQLALRGLGVGRPKHIEQHFTRGGYPNLKTILAQLEAEGLIEQVVIRANGQSWPGNWYIHSADLPLLESLQAGNWHPRTTLLSPFDNLICDRQRTEDMFNFYYRSEIYTPKAKRQYGYYVLPILCGDQFIGRIDPKLDRKKKQLLIHAIHLEPDTPLALDLKTGRQTVAAIESLARFLGAADIVYPADIPSAWKKAF